MKSVSVNQLHDLLEKHLGKAIGEIEYVEIASELNAHDPVMKMVGAGGVLNVFFRVLGNDEVKPHD